MKTDNKKVNQTVVFCVRQDASKKVTHVCVARKKKKVGAGFYNGHGGGFEDGEDSRKCAIRELSEETNNGITSQTKDLQPAARIDIVCTPFNLEVSLYVFLLSEFEGEFLESDEMGVGEWLDVDKLPLDEFMPADRQFLGRIFNGEKLTGDIILVQGEVVQQPDDPEGHKALSRSLKVARCTLVACRNLDF